MTYYYGFLFTIVVNSIIWWVISYVVSKLLCQRPKSRNIRDKKKIFNLKNGLVDTVSMSALGLNVSM